MPDCKQRISFFDQRIHQERSAIRLAWGLAVFVIAIAISVGFLSYYMGEVGIKMVGPIGSAFFGLIASFPLKEYPSYKTNISKYQHLRACYEELDGHPEKAEDLELAKLEDLYWKYLEGK